MEQSIAFNMRFDPGFQFGNEPTYCGFDTVSLQWRHHDRDGVSNHQRLGLFTQPFVQARIKEINYQNSASLAFVTDEFPTQRASNA